MGLFRRSQSKNIWAELNLADPTIAVPVVDQNVQAKTDEQDLVQLRRTFAPKGKAYRWISRRMKYDHARRVNLDVWGTQFWRLIDGERSLEQIAERMTRANGVAINDSRKAVLRFAGYLVQRNLILLVVPRAHLENAST